MLWESKRIWDVLVYVCACVGATTRPMQVQTGTNVFLSVFRVFIVFGEFTAA